MFRQAIPRIGLSIESGTGSVPEDGLFHVLLNGQEVFSSNSQREALAKYRELKESLLSAGQPRESRAAKTREALHREMADRQVGAFLSQSARQKRAKAVRK
jgi:hypothetical protein